MQHTNPSDNSNFMVCCPEDVDLKLRGQTCRDPDETQNRIQRITLGGVGVKQAA